MNRAIWVVVLIALLAALAACAEASDEQVAAREQSLFARESQVEIRLCQDGKIDELWEQWQDWAGERIDGYEYLSNSDKVAFLNKFEDTLDNLEDTAKEVC